MSVTKVYIGTVSPRGNILANQSLLSISLHPTTSICPHKDSSTYTTLSQNHHSISPSSPTTNLNHKLDLDTDKQNDDAKFHPANTLNPRPRQINLLHPQLKLIHHNLEPSTQQTPRLGPNPPSPAAADRLSRRRTRQRPPELTPKLRRPVPPRLDLVKGEHSAPQRKRESGGGERLEDDGTVVGM